MLKKHKVVLIAATSNELLGVTTVLPKIDRKLVDDIVVVDLNSTDGTVEFCKKIGVKVHHQKTRGYGSAMREALDINRNEIIVEFPPDGSSPPDKVPDLIKKIEEGYDMVIASRYLKGVKSYDDDIITSFGNFMFTRIVNILFGTKFTDVLIGYRAYRRSVLDKVNLQAKGLDWAVEIPLLMAKYGAKITDIPCDEPKRLGGKRKMRIIRHGLEICRAIIWQFLHPRGHLKN